MVAIYLTSFFKTEQLPGNVRPFSAAVYQPKGYAFPKVDWTDIRKNGEWIRPREFLDTPDPLNAYWAAMKEHYNARIFEARAWLESLEEDAALCCWCPHDRAAKRQIQEFGTYICHTGPLGEFLEELGASVWWDHDRRSLAYPYAR